MSRADDDGEPWFFFIIVQRLMWCPCVLSDDYSCPFPDTMTTTMVAAVSTVDSCGDAMGSQWRRRRKVVLVSFVVLCVISHVRGI